MYLKGIGIAPHPPILLPEIGKGEEEKAAATIRGIKDMALKIAKAKPKTIVCITPHGNVFQDGVSLLYKKTLTGNFAAFGAPQITMEKECDQALLDNLNQSMGEHECYSIFINDKTAQEYAIETQLDHGVMVPLSFVDKVYPHYRIVHITIGHLSLMELYRTGRIIREAIETTQNDTVILASADLSHCLKDKGPYKKHPMGEVFDQTVVAAIQGKDYHSLLTLSPEIYEPAGQCGLRPIVMALGATDSIKTTTQTFSYQGPFGVGYLTAWIDFDLNQEDPTNESLLTRLEREMEKAHEERIAKADAFARLAVTAVDTWALEGRAINAHQYLNELNDLEAKAALEESAGVFVTLYKSGELRGCMGTINAVTPNIAEEIIRNAIEACAFDPRFLPVEKEELTSLEISVSVLGMAEEVEDISVLDPHHYGIIVEKGLNRGLLLPNIPGIDTVEEQLTAVLRKAEIPDHQQTPEDEAVNGKLILKRFEVEEHR